MLDDKLVKNVAIKTGRMQEASTNRAQSAEVTSLFISHLFSEGSADPDDDSSDKTGEFVKNDRETFDDQTEQAGSSAAPPHPIRRVSFADEAEDSSVDDTSVSSHQNSQLDLRHVHDLLQNDPHDDDNITAPRKNRRSSYEERRSYTLALIRAAHGLMFTDTRPDGLRPITGSPMVDGEGPEGVGGLYVGLAGLRGFDLSFVGATSASPNLPASQSNNTTADCNTKLPSATPEPTTDPSWLDKRSLLDRKPGSLIPTEPRSGSTQGALETPTPPGSSGEAEETGGLLTSSSSDQPFIAIPTYPSTGRNKKKYDARAPKREEERTNDKVIEMRGREEATAERNWLGKPSMPTGATSAAALFAPKAAILWSAENVGMDDLAMAAACRHGKKVNENNFGNAVLFRTFTEERSRCYVILRIYAGQVFHHV